MIKFLCAALAKCFDAHLTEEEKKAKEQVAIVRKKAQEFNEELKNLQRFGNTGFVTFYQYGKKTFVSLHSFSLDEINYTLNRSERL